MQGGITGKRLIYGLLILALSWGVWASPVQAQSSGKTDPLSRDITVSHYQTNPKTGLPHLVARWPWLNYGEFYRLMALAPAAAVTSPDSTLQTKPHDQFIITETNPNGDVLTELMIEDDRVQITYFVYDDMYYDDVLDSGNTLRAWIKKNPSQKAVGPHARATFTWGEKGNLSHLSTDDPFILNLASETLKKSPKIEGVDRLRLTHDFTSTDRLRLEMLEPDLPHRIDFDLYQIRATRITPQTRTYIDRYNILGQALGQRALAQKYKSLGYGTPPKTY